MPTRFLINQCQIISVLILKYDIIENSRIELRGIVLPVQVGGLLGEGGAKGMLARPLKLLGGAWPPCIPPPLFLRLCIGLTLSSTCTWSDHIGNICGQAWTRLNLKRALKFRVSWKSLEQIYISFIRPFREFFDSVWDNSSTEANKKKQLEAIYIEAGRTITGTTKLCSINRLLDDLGWNSLQSRRNKLKLTIFYKIMNGLKPTYLSDLLPPLVHETTSYNLRHSNHI